MHATARASVRWKRRIGIGLCGLAGAVTVLLVAALAFTNTRYFRGAFIETVAARSGRHIQVDGALDVRLLSSAPSVRAEKVTIGNPRWMPAGTTARIDELVVIFDFPLPWRTSQIRRLELVGAKLNLMRNEASNTNWQLSAPGTARGGPGRLIRSLHIPDAHVVLDDARRHIQYNGTLSALDARGPDGAPLLRLEGRGQLNGRPASFAVNADPLASASHDRPYRFVLAERSGDAQLKGRGAFPRPFDRNQFDVTFHTSGTSLRDIFYLVGMRLPNSAPYTLTGQLSRRGSKSTFSKLQARVGESSLAGTIATETIAGRSHLTADLHAKVFRLADLGRHAPDGSPIRKVPAKKLLLPDVELPLKVLSRRDAVIRFSADSLVMHALSFEAFDATGTIEKGVLTTSSLSAAFRNAHVTGSVKLDVNPEVPVTTADLKLAGLQLSQFFRKGGVRPPLEGVLQGRVQVTGQGNSLHDVAASATGNVMAVLPRGAVRASLAELTGLNFRGLGLMLTSKDADVPVRCAVASFQAREGTLRSQHLVIDTEPVLIRGDGAIHLDSEALDLTLKGAPKQVRLGRVRSPVYVRGTLSDPSFGLDAGHVLAQTGGAVALGIALTPIAAVLALVDPGLARDADCSALEKEALNRRAAQSRTLPPTATESAGSETARQK